jgi:hypothetical protein
MADPSRNPNFGYMTEQMLEVNIASLRIRFFLNILIVAIITIEKSADCSTSTTPHY